MDRAPTNTNSNDENLRDIGEFPHLNIVILCGQTGDNLWPLVKHGVPRETVVMPGESESLLQQTIKWTRRFTDNKIIFVCSKDVSADISKAILSYGLLKKKDFTILESPCRRGTAFDIALAAAYLKPRDSQACMLVVPSNVSIQGDDAFDQSLVRAYRAATQDLICVIGATPSEDNPIHPFIRMGRELKGTKDVTAGLPSGVRAITRYIADPTKAQAKRFAGLEMVWSTGIIAARANTVLAQLTYVAKHGSTPVCIGMDRVVETASFLASIDRSNWRRDEAYELVSSLPSASFEQAVLEESRQSAVIPSAITCSAVQTLANIDDLSTPDANGNRVTGKGIAVNSQSTTIYGTDRLVAAFGCDDMLIVDVGGSVLVTPKSQLHDIDSLAPELIKAGYADECKPVEREQTWGYSSKAFEGAESSASIVSIDEHEEIPEYVCRSHSEIWVVLEGEVEVISNGQSSVCNIGCEFELHRWQSHSIRNSGQGPARLMCIERH